MTIKAKHSKTRMKKTVGRAWLCVIFLTMFFSCVETYDVRISGNRKYLIVEGTLTDVFDQKQQVKIFETDDQSDFISSDFTKTIFSIDNEALPATGAEVIVVENDVTRYQLVEVEPGIYEMPFGFRAAVGNSYQLEFTLKDNRRYQSSKEDMLPVTPIKDFEVRLNEEGIQTPRLYNIRIPSQDIYIDFDDPADEQNFYSWSWVNYEVQNICNTCRQGRYFDDVGETGACVTDPALNVNNIFDYNCLGFCWEIFPGEDIQIFSDVFTDGLTQEKKLVAQVPVLQENSSLLVIQQKSMTPGAFRYLKLIEDQSINSGSLADTPPAPIRGNVSNVEKSEELVLGYFTASGVNELRHMLVRFDVPNAIPDNLFRMLNNREPVYESEGDYRAIIPFATCEQSSSRTPNAPRNWQFGL